jgi:hypothetical protein
MTVGILNVPSTPFTEVLMANRTVSLRPPTITPEVQAFAAEKGITRYLNPVIEVARRAFPSAPLAVSLGEDAEDSTHRYIALDAEVGGLSPEELVAGQRAWSAGVSQVCPSRDAVWFVLGWR